MDRGRDHGAAVVEFALVLPLLAAMTIGIIAFGYLFHVQSVLDNAARDGVRVATLTTGTAATAAAAARTTAQASASTTVALATTDIDVDLTACASPASSTNDRLAHVTIELDDFSLLGLATISLAGTGSMRCNG